MTMEPNETVTESTQEIQKISKPEEQPTPAGKLFDSIVYKNTEDVPRFIETMGGKDAAMIVLSAATYAHKKGILTLLESEILSKAIRIFTTPPASHVPPEEKIQQPIPNKEEKK